MNAISIDILPAARGDCLWIECARPVGPPWRLLIDGGMPESWPLLRDRINRLSATGPVVFDLAVVSHIDSDHIGGMLPLFAATDLDVSFKDVWFNGLQQLPENNDLRSRSVTEGEQLVELLSGQQGTRKQPWNAWFGGAAVMIRGDGAFETIAFPGGPTLSLLSPTPRRLASLRKTWTTDLLRLQRGESDGPPEAAVPMPLDDLATLAAVDTRRDQSVANGSSIAFLLEHGGRRCLLAADAFSSVLGSALTSLANSRDGRPIELDVFKLPHHCSKGNVTANLLAIAPAQHYIVSTNGDRFHHPDDIALARVVTGPARQPTIWFNYVSDAARRWSDPTMQAEYGFSTRPPDANSGPGIHIKLQAKP
jgi:beta-lactamase superfamily II metal-dependent hydrolase